MTVKNSIVVPQVDFNELIANSTYIVEGKVTNILESTVEKIKFPATNEVCLSIVTDTEIEVKNVIKGELLQNNIFVRRNVGKVDTTTFICDEETTFNIGDDVLLFLADDGVSETYRVSYYKYGQYFLLDNGKYQNALTQDIVSVNDIVIN